MRGTNISSVKFTIISDTIDRLTNHQVKLYYYFKICVINIILTSSLDNVESPTQDKLNSKKLVC